MKRLSGVSQSPQPRWWQRQRGPVGPRGRVTLLSIKVACPLFATQKYLLAITLISEAATTFTSEGTSAQWFNRTTTTTMQTQRVKAKKH